MPYLRSPMIHWLLGALEGRGCLVQGVTSVLESSLVEREHLPAECG